MDMKVYSLTELATDENFTEEAYLKANPDVAKAVSEGVHLASGRLHFDIFGKTEKRCIRLSPSVIAEPKKKKLERIKPLLRKDMVFIENTGHSFDFLNDDLKKLYNIISTDAVSSNPYDTYIEDIIKNNDNGLVLDCGSGRRDLYYDHVVNFDIAEYDTTDVMGVGEDLPFKDNSFDVVLSLSVLEHVKDPFKCAGEIARVLKPGGLLICCVPFLQPYHGYPHHYYNMTGQGLKNLFDDKLEIDKIEITVNELPVWSLTWILRNWANGLKGETREAFLEMKIGTLIKTGDKYLEEAFVKELTAEKNYELAYANVLFAHKKLDL